MNNLTITTRLRFVAAIAPAILLIVAALIVGAFHFFGTMTRAIHDNQYAAARSAEGMANALYRMDWGRSQPDSAQIIMDQQRGFISEIEIARAHMVSREQAERIEKIANDAKPLFEAMRTAQPGDDSLEPRLRDLQGTVADLMSVDDAMLLAAAASAESTARTMIAITIIGVVVVPWICFIVIARLTGRLYAALREIRRRFEALAERGELPEGDARAVDHALAELGFPKPNPMLAE
ncbi:MAG TPA: hypothetical protein VLI44_02890 [Sporolactobacillaceae bacterium]|nr:hypothetical protein [Sporolactobacillaceae bacterium]